MNIGIIVYSDDPETVWNAFRFGNCALKKGDNTKVLLMGKGVECESRNTDKFNVTEQIRSFIDNDGETSCLWLLPQNPTLRRLRNMSSVNHGRPT